MTRTAKKSHAIWTQDGEHLVRKGERTSEPGFDMEGLWAYLPELCDLADVTSAKGVGLKGPGGTDDYFLGRDPQTSVVRVSSSTGSLIVKIHRSERTYEIERNNLRFLSRLVPALVPGLVRCIDDRRALVLQDLGNVCPPPSDLQHDTSDVLDLWHSIVSSIAEVHHSASCNMALLDEIYGGRAPSRSLPEARRLATAVGEGVGACTGRPVNAAVADVLAGEIRELTACLSAYRDATGGYSMGERSIANIRLWQGQPVHLDHCQEPRSLPHADLVSVWRSPRRARLLAHYATCRQRLEPAFDVGQFVQTDRQFSVVASLVWVGIRAGTWHAPTARVGRVMKGTRHDPLIRANLETVARCASALGRERLGEAAQRMLAQLAA